MIIKNQTYISRMKKRYSIYNRKDKQEIDFIEEENLIQKGSFNSLK